MGFNGDENENTAMRSDGLASTEVTSESGEDSPSFKEQLLGIRLKRTETLADTQELRDVK